MPRSLRIILVAIGAAGGLVLAAAILVPLLVDTNAYKRRFEEAASDPLGLEVRVGARLAIAFSQHLLITLHDVRVRNTAGAEILAAERIRVAVALFPLLRNEVRIKQVTLLSPRVSIERGRDGAFNFEKRKEPKGSLPILDRARISVADGALLYADSASGSRLEALDLMVSADRLRLSEGRRATAAGRVSLRATIACKELRTKDLAISDVWIALHAEDGVFDLNPVTMRAFGGRGSGNVRADLSNRTPRYRLRSSLSQVRVEECLKTLSPSKIAAGSMNASASLSMNGRRSQDLVQSARGEISLHGEDIRLSGHDLDREFSRFESSQNLDLVDVGTFFFVGPLGVAVTKGFDFARLFRGSGGNTTIRALVSQWGVEGGGIEARDVAMATDKHRLALKGRLDFVRQRFDSVTVALVDENGCAKVRQELRGSFQKPELRKPSVLGSLVGPAVRVYRRTKDLLPGGPCEVFYEGSVPAPK